MITMRESYAPKRGGATALVNTDDLARFEGEGGLEALEPRRTSGAIDVGMDIAQATKQGIENHQRMKIVDEIEYKQEK